MRFFDGSQCIILICMVLPCCVTLVKADPADRIVFEDRQTERATYRVDPELGDRAAALIALFDERLAATDRAFHDRARILAEAEAILPDLNRLLGLDVNDQQLEKQRELLHAFAGDILIRPAPADELVVTLADHGRAFEHLKAGGTLPHVTLDGAEGGMRMDLNLTVKKSDASASRWVRRWTVAHKSGEPIESASGLVLFDLFDMQRDISLGLALHEIAEITLLKTGTKGRPADPHWRWFSDGLANVLTLRLLETHGYDDEAANLRQHFDAEPFEDLRPRADLRYWLEKKFQPQVDAFGEDRLSQARYAFATAEMQRLVDEHGVDWIAPVFDARLDPAGRVSTERIIAAITQHTGVAMNDRLDQYQSFDTPEAGVEAQVARYADAVQHERHGEAATAAIRLLELQFESLEQGPSGNQWMAIVRQLGKAEAYEDSLAVMRQMQELGMRGNAESERFKLAALAAQTAVMAGDLSLADGLVDPMRTRRPDHPLSRLFTAHEMSNAGQVEAAAAEAQAALAASPDVPDPLLRPRFEALARRLIEAAESP